MMNKMSLLTATLFISLIASAQEKPQPAVEPIKAAEKGEQIHIKQMQKSELKKAPENLAATSLAMTATQRKSVASTKRTKGNCKKLKRDK